MNKVSVGYDARSVIVNNKRILLLSGAIHYPRIMPSAWRDIIRKSKKAGLNCVETYVFWEGHEPQEGEYIFSGRYNLPRFLEICQSEGMYVILRIGPYICSEWNFGGLAWWLMTKKGMVTRTWNKPFMNAVEDWVRVLMAKVGQCQITYGGPVILIQMENEYGLVQKRYGRDGKRYLKWIAEMARAVGVEVPIIMCEGATGGTIETMNGFSAWPLIDRHRKRSPDTPLLWTENWPSYDTWGKAHNTRKVEGLSYEVLRFFAMGGVGVNYYMWHGGTNFGRDAMFLQTTSYDFDAPLDEYGLPTQKYNHLKKLHLVLLKYQNILFEGKMSGKVVSRPQQAKKGDGVYIYSWKRGARTLLFLVNGGQDPRTANVENLSVRLPGLSGMIFLKGGKSKLRKLFATWEVPSRISRRMIPCKRKLSWGMRKEPLPDQLPVNAARKIVSLEKPKDMLSFTRDETDYAWYQTFVDVSGARTAKLTLTNVGDRAAVWVNGKYLGSAPERLEENWRTRFTVEFHLPLKKGRNRIAILVSALGLIKGDWMIDAPQSEDKKGLWGDVILGGRKVRGDWTLEVGLQGEHIRCFDPEVSSIITWEPISRKQTPLRWYKASFTVSCEELSDSAPWAVCAAGLKKGFIWVNGTGLGRYWQIPSPQTEPDYRFGNEYVVPVGFGKPPQIFYHIPREVMRKRNTIVIFDEEGASPDGVYLVRRR